MFLAVTPFMHFLLFGPKPILWYRWKFLCRKTLAHFKTGDFTFSVSVMTGRPKPDEPNMFLTPQDGAVMSGDCLT